MANLHFAEKIAIEPTSTKIVTLNRGFRVAEAGDGVAVVSSEEHVVQGGPAVVRVNKLGQVVIGDFQLYKQCDRIKKDSALGIIENIHSNEDSVGELNVKNLTAQLEELEPNSQKPITAEKKKYILENAQLNVLEEFGARYIDLLLRNHEVISSNKYDLHDIKMKSEDPIYIKQFRIPEAQREESKNMSKSSSN